VVPAALQRPALPTPPPTVVVVAAAATAPWPPVVPAGTELPAALVGQAAGVAPAGTGARPPASDPDLPSSVA
jgi:hypothetical protein